MPVFLLDSWALMAYLQDEAGAGAVEQLLLDAEESRADCWISLINLGEVLYTVARRRTWEEAVMLVERIRAVPVQVLPVSESQVFAAARIKSEHRVSYADAIAVAAAQELKAELVTGDPEISALGGVVSVRDLRERDLS